jgi:uncharacterized membrane protein
MIARTTNRGSPGWGADPAASINDQVAAWITTRVGSMWTVYICLAVTAVWMVLGSRQVLGRSADRRSMYTYEDAEAILVDCEQIQNHLIAQDTHLASAGAIDADEQEKLARAAERAGPPPTVAGEYVGVNGRLAAGLTSKVGTMTACYLALIFQAGWMVAGQPLHFDPYPFLFLLFLSSLAQLLLMFVIMVGQRVLGQAAEKRAALTYLNAEAVLRACGRLQAHLRAQDLALRQVVEHMRECQARLPGEPSGDGGPGEWAG